MDPVFFHRNPETAPADGPLRGLRVAIQPNLSVESWPTEAGSNALAGYIALEDATIVERLRRSGASLCGSTRTSEFGLGLLDSRAGDALRDQAADVEVVLDLMGESRLAAARAGVYGFKPSYGLVSRFGLIGLIPSMECCGLLSGSIRNIREILQAVEGQDGRDYSLPDRQPPDLSPQTVQPAETTIGVMAEACGDVSAEQREAFRSSLDRLEAAGFALREVSLPDWPLFSPVHNVVGSVEASSCAGRYDSVRYGPRAPGAKNWNEMYLLSRGAAFGTLLKSYLMQGAYFQFEHYGAFEDAARIRARLVEKMHQLANQVDYLAFPLVDGASGHGAASNRDTSSVSGTYAQFASSLFANLTGQPALYVPLAGAEHWGLQLAGPRLSDGRLLALGEWLQNADRGGN